MISFYRGVLSIATILLYSGLTYAGWTSGGGELIRDANNPWFIQNVTEVKYCVKIDEKNFSLSKSLAEERIKDALNYWKREFKASGEIDGRYDADILIGRQTFLQVDCSPAVDLQILLGVLPDDDSSEKWNPRNYLGITIRTQYDPVLMRGKGFIYISPDSGPLKYNSKDVMEDPWKKYSGHLFRIIMMHELGHVFGISHQTVPRWGIMHQSFPEWMVSAKLFAMQKREDQDDDFLSKWYPGFFAFDPKNQQPLGYSCDKNETGFRKSPQSPRFLENDFEFSAKLLDFFSVRLPAPETCWEFRIDEKGNFELKVGEDDGRPEKWPVVGTAKLDWDETKLSQVSQAIVVWLPDEQKVIEPDIGRPRYRFTGSRQRVIKFKGQYVSTDGKIRRSVFGEVDPSGLELNFGGKLNEKVFMSIGW